MKIQKNKPNKLYVVLIVVLLCGVLAVLVLRPDTDGSVEQSPPPVSSGEQTIRGEAVCLPHKDTSGPQTLECAFGVKLEDGTYYALRDADNYSTISTLEMGKDLRLTGTLKLEQSDRYQSIGTFTVTKAIELQ